MQASLVLVQVYCPGACGGRFGYCLALFAPKNKAPKHPWNEKKTHWHTVQYGRCVESVLNMSIEIHEIRGSLFVDLVRQKHKMHES